jgi:hypothetical protein
MEVLVGAGGVALGASRVTVGANRLSGSPLQPARSSEEKISQTSRIFFIITHT